MDLLPFEFGVEKRILKIPAAGGDPVRVLDRGGYAASESPDGRSLYYARSDGGPLGLWRLNLATREETRLIAAVQGGSAFTLGEKGIYFVPPPKPGEAPRIQFLDFAGGAVRTVITLQQRVAEGLSVSPDGRVLIFDQRDNMDSDLMLVENFR